MSGSAVGDEARLLTRQLARFNAAHPTERVVLRVTPDAADQRHQLYVQWLNARSTEPDVLQLDVVWTPEFAAAGWILPLDRFHPHLEDFFEAAITANRWQKTLYAVPWFIDVGMLYWRTDLLDRPPATFESLAHETARVQRERGVRYGLVWQGARYEGLVTVFLEYLGGFGGRMLDEDGRVVVDSIQGVQALRAMWDGVHGSDPIVPEASLAWQEEQTRFAFQNGDAVLMRNWPYAAPLLGDSSKSRVAGRFAVASMPSAPGGVASATLGGSQLAINARSRHPESAFALIEFLTAPEQMIERMREVGQYPSRPGLYDTRALSDVSTLPPLTMRSIIERAVPRPVTPVYMQLSEILQGRLHGALTGQ
ncbi:MAG: ABC transporter substrate-binding protein, partial [Vicinamibacterales bacterium]